MRTVCAYRKPDPATAKLRKLGNLKELGNWGEIGNLENWGNWGNLEEWENLENLEKKAERMKIEILLLF